MIYIRRQDGVTFGIDATNCDGSQDTIISFTSCTVPVSTLKGGAFLLTWGSSVYAKVVAYNNYGDSGESEIGNGAIILTNPDPPINVEEVIAMRAPGTVTL